MDKKQSDEQPGQAPTPSLLQNIEMRQTKLLGPYAQDQPLLRLPTPLPLHAHPPAPVPSTSALLERMRREQARELNLTPARHAAGQEVKMVPEVNQPHLKVPLPLVPPALPAQPAPVLPPAPPAQPTPVAQPAPLALRAPPTQPAAVAQIHGQDADVEMTDATAITAEVTFDRQDIRIRFGSDLPSRLLRRPAAHVMQNLTKRVPAGAAPAPAKVARAPHAVPVQAPVSQAQQQQSLRDQWDARTNSRFVSITEAAEEAKLPRFMVNDWCEQNLVRNIKPQVKNARRLVDLRDVLRLMDQQVLPSLPRMLEATCRSLLYVRADPREDLTEADALVELTARVNELEAAFKQQVQVPPNWEANTAREVGYAADFGRVGFIQLMAVISRRDIDNLVVFNDEQLCPAACMPLFEWICEQNLVTIVRIEIV